MDGSRLANVEFPIVVDRKESQQVSSYQIPDWVKNNAGWWATNQIPDSAFVDGIEFLVKERIIDNVKTGNVESASSAVPTWVKNNAGWWAEGQIDDNSFVKGIEYLVKVGLIQVT